MKFILVIAATLLATTSSATLVRNIKYPTSIIGRTRLRELPLLNPVQVSSVQSMPVPIQVQQMPVQIAPVASVASVQPLPVQVAQVAQPIFVGKVQAIANEAPVQVPVVQSTQHLQVYPVPVEPGMQRTQVVAIEPSQQPVHLLFKSASSPLSVQQQHTPAERTHYETTRSEEEPHVIRHEVFKPVVQELRETIQPYRQVTQEIRPVLEKVNVVVPKGIHSQQALSGVSAISSGALSGSISGGVSTIGTAAISQVTPVATSVQNYPRMFAWQPRGFLGGLQYHYQPFLNQYQYPGYQYVQYRDLPREYFREAATPYNVEQQFDEIEEEKKK